MSASFRSKLVTPNPRLQGCLFLNNRTGDSSGEPRLVWVNSVDMCPVFALIQCVMSCLGSCLQWCLKTLIIFLFIEKFNSCTRVSLVNSRVQRSVYTGFSIAHSRTVCGLLLYTVAYKPEQQKFWVRVYLSLSLCRFFFA